jgi:hypothetical protein
MSALAPLAARHDAWRKSALDTVAPVLASARAELVAAQRGPEADDAIARVEELLRAELEPILLKQERAHEPIARAVDAWFESAPEPTDADYEVQTRVGGGGDWLRDHVERKVASLVAQARAAELAPGAAAADKGGFCGSCGAPVTPAMKAARRCGYCQAGMTP